MKWSALVLVFDMDQSRVSFHVLDLDHNSLEVSHADYQQGGLNPSNWILVGDLPKWDLNNSSAFSTDGLFDDPSETLDSTFVEPASLTVELLTSEEFGATELT